MRYFRHTRSGFFMALCGCTSALRPHSAVGINTHASTALRGHQVCSGAGGPKACVLGGLGCSWLPSVHVFLTLLIHAVGRERGREEVWYITESSVADSYGEVSGLTKYGVYGHKRHILTPAPLFRPLVSASFAKRQQRSPASVQFSPLSAKGVTILNEGVTRSAFFPDTTD